MVRRRASLLALVLLAPLAARAEAPTAPTPDDPGSLAPGVVLEDITHTLRSASFRSATVSRHDPAVAYVSSWDGYLWKTVDGGRTWDESRLIVETRPFYGDQGQRLYFGVHRGDGAERRVQLPTLPAPFPLSAALTAAAGGAGAWVVRGLGDAVAAAFSAAPGGGGGGSSNVNFGIGLPGGAPRLQLLVRKLGKPTSGVNMKQTLALRGTRPTEIRITVIHPHNPRVVFACSAFGLFRSRDAGDTWVRVHSGTRPSDRWAYHVAVDPKDGNRVLLGSSDGLWISTDGGSSFAKATQGGVGGGAILWVYFYPYDPRYIFAGTDSGLLRSADNGASWDYVYFTTFPAARVVSYVEVDPHDRKTGYITTADGLFTTPDLLSGGLESWSRLGGLRFSGIVSEKVHACPRHRGHLWTFTNMRTASVAAGGVVDAGGAFIMESVDGGASWRAIDAGNTAGSMQWFDNDPRDPDLLWIVWSRSLTRMARRTADLARRRRAAIPADPPIGEVLLAAQMYTGVDPGRQLDYRARARWKALLPRIEAGWTGLWTHSYSLERDGLFRNLSFRFEQALPVTRSELRIMAVWDLADLVFSLDRTSFGRVDRLGSELRDTLKLAIHRSYGELRRLRALMARDPPGDLRVRLMYRVRIEELESYVNFMTGNYLARWRQGRRAPGIETGWWAAEPATADER